VNLLPAPAPSPRSVATVSSPPTNAADVGVDEGTNVSSAYKEYDNKFTGKIEKVTVDVR